MKNVQKIIALAFLLFPVNHINAQRKSVFPERLLKEDSATVAAIAVYPESVRKNILEACLYPEALIKIEILQENTSASFKSALQDYSKETQIKIWDIARYPGLLTAMTQGGKKSKEELKKIASSYPSEVSETIMESGRKDFELLVKVNQLNKKSEDAFEELMKDYPAAARPAFQEIVKYPEAIKVLTSGMRVTVLLGDAYKKDAEAVRSTLDSLSIVYARQNAKNLEDWKNGLEKNPEAKKEMEKAAEKFAKDEGYDEDELVINDPEIVINYVYYPYSYWMGYPWWYEYPYWYPYPYWYDWGFYWTSHGIVYIGLPSYYYTWWYFNHYHHHYYYYHFTDYCVNYHYGHRNSITGFNREVSRWITVNENKLPQNYFSEAKGRPERIKELGRFDIEYSESGGKIEGKGVSRDEYLQANADRYPQMKPGAKDPSRKEERPVIHDPSKEHDPVYYDPNREKPKIKIPKNPEPVKPRIEPKPRYQQPKIPPKVRPKTR